MVLDRADRKPKPAGGELDSGAWIDRIYRDGPESITVRVKVTNIVFMHVLRSCMFELGLIDLLEAGLSHGHDELRVDQGSICLDKSLFARQYLSVLQQLDRLTSHQRKKVRECAGHGAVHIKGPAGSGKTFVALHVVVAVMKDHESEMRHVAQETTNLENKLRILFVAPSPAMCLFFGQWLLQRYEKQHGGEGALVLTKEYIIDVIHFDKGRSQAKPSSHVAQRLVFNRGSVTLGARAPTDSETAYALVVVDEAHHVFNTSATEDASLTFLNAQITACAGTFVQTVSANPTVLLCSDLAQFDALDEKLISFPRIFMATSTMSDVHNVVLEEVVRNSAKIVSASQAFSKTEGVDMVSHSEVQGPPLRPYLLPDSAGITKADAMKRYADAVQKSLLDFFVDFGEVPLHRCAAMLVPGADFCDQLGAALVPKSRMCSCCRKHVSIFELEGRPAVRVKIVPAVEGPDCDGGACAGSQQVVLDTIGSFDGMERLLILAIGLDTERSDAGSGADGSMIAACSMIYRAMTRAHLFVAVIQQHLPGGWLEFLAAVTPRVTPANANPVAVTEVVPASDVTVVPGQGGGHGDSEEEADAVDYGYLGGFNLRRGQQLMELMERNRELKNKSGAINSMAQRQAGSKGEEIVPDGIETLLWETNKAADAGEIKVRPNFYNPWSEDSEVQDTVQLGSAGGSLSAAVCDAVAAGLLLNVNLDNDHLAAPGLRDQLWAALKSPKCRVANLK